MADRRILESFPLPHARGYRRFRNAVEPRERHDTAYYLFEVYLKYAGAIAIAHYLAGEGRDHRVNAVLKGLARPSLGEWLRFLRECLRFLGEEKEPDGAIRSLATLFEERERRPDPLVGLYNGLRSFRTETRSDRDKISLAMLFEEVVAYRNRVIGHGVPPGKDHLLRFGDLFGEAFPHLLDESGYLTARRLVAFDSLQVEEGSRIECGVMEYMSDRPIRREAPHVIPYGQEAPEKLGLYLLGGDGRLVSLDPLLIAHEDDVYLLNEAEKEPEYLSYATGARRRHPRGGEAQTRLFERILGYRVDSSRLGRLEDDLVPATGAAAVPAADGARRLGDYRIVREVGRGAMGAVFEAVQESLGRRVALKVLPGDFVLDSKRVERFRREARATARIHHPNIVPVYEVGEADGTHYYAMEFIEGASLDRAIDDARARKAAGGKPGSSSSPDSARIAGAVEGIAGLAEGLEKAHRLGLVHRDVKPSNILVEDGGRHVLVDFGLVRDAGDPALTRSGEMVGTLAYMSPEQVARGPVDARADVYSLGVTLYEILMLRTPYRGESDPELQRAILFEEPLAPRKLNPRLHRDLETIILHALEKNPERRYPSAGELAADLRRFLRYEPIRARPQSAWTRIRRRAAKHRGALLAAAAVLLIALAGGSAILRSHLQERARAERDYAPNVRGAAVRMQLGRLSMKVGAGYVGAGYLARFDRHALQLRGSFQALSEEVGRGPVERSVAELAAAAAAVPARPDAYYHRARGLLLLGREGEARADLDRALERESRFVPALVLRSVLREQQGDREGAARDRRRAVDLGQGGWGEAWLAAQEAMTAGRWNEAAEAYGKLIEPEGEGSQPYLGSLEEALLGRGVARLEAEDFQEALLDFARAQEHMPDSPHPAILLGATRYLMAQEQKAEEVFEGFHRRTRLRDDFAIEVAGLYYAFFEFSRALRWVERIEERGSVRARNRCLFLTEMDRFGEAIAAGRNAIGLDPRDALAHVSLAMAHRRAGQEAEARELTEKAIRLAPGNSYVHFEAAGMKRRRSTRDAEEHYRKAIEIDRYDSWSHGHLGTLLGGEEGRSEVEKCIALDPGGFIGHAERGDFLEDDGKHDEAAGSFCRSIEVNPTVQHAHERLFGLLRRKELSPASAQALGHLVEKLERLLSWGADDTRLIRKTLALVSLHHPVAPEPHRALHHARRAVETAGRRDPDLLATLAEVQFTAGDHAGAVLSLEEALRLPNGPRALLRKLRVYRRACLPALASPASIDAAIDELDLETLVGEGDSWRYFEGRSEPPSDWTGASFDGSAWSEGPSGFGYGDPGMNTFLEGMRGSYSTLYLRKTFHLRDPRLYRRLLLRVEADDGFVAFLNGKEVDRVRAGQELTYQATADGDAPEPLVAREVEIDPAGLLPGANVLAVMGLNRSLDASSDFFLNPSLIGELHPDPENASKRIARFRPGTDGESASLTAYLEGRLLQRERKPREAAEKFSLAVEAESRRFEPVLRLAESLRDCGEAVRAERTLRDALERGLPDDRDLWLLWAAISLGDLKRSPAELLADLPKAHASARGEDVRWLLDRLRSGAAVRINCGGGECPSPRGPGWWRDSFFEAGTPADYGRPEFPGEIGESGGDPVYRTERSFDPDGHLAARYRVPLPPGGYRVTLHFAELVNGMPGTRRFDVALEGRTVLPDFDPGAAGFAIAQRKVFEGVRVVDGALEVDLAPVAGDARIAGLAIEKMNP